MVVCRLNFSPSLLFAGPETELKYFPKTYKSGFFGKKTMGFSEREHDFSTQIVKKGKFAAETVQNDVISQKCLFSKYTEFFHKKIKSFYFWKK